MGRMNVPKVYPLTICSELAVVKLVHAAAVRIEDQCNAPFPFVQVMVNLKILPTVRMYNPDMESEQLINKITEMRKFVSELLPHLLQQRVLNCAYYIFARLGVESYNGSEYGKDYENVYDNVPRMLENMHQEYISKNYEKYEDKFTIRNILSILNRDDDLVNMFSKCTLGGKGELVTFAILANVDTKHLHLVGDERNILSFKDEREILNILEYNDYLCTELHQMSHHVKEVLAGHDKKVLELVSTHWNYRSVSLFKLMLTSCPNLTRLELNHVTNEVLESIGKLRNLEYLTISLDNKEVIERGLLAVCGKKIDASAAHIVPDCYSADEIVTANIEQDDLITLGPWIVDNEYLKRTCTVAGCVRNEFLCCNAHVVHDPEVIAARIAGLVDTEAGCIKLKEIVIKTRPVGFVDTSTINRIRFSKLEKIAIETKPNDITFFKKLMYEPLVQSGNTYVGCSLAALMMFLPRLRVLSIGLTQLDHRHDNYLEPNNVYQQLFSHVVAFKKKYPELVRKKQVALNLDHLCLDTDALELNEVAIEAFPETDTLNTCSLNACHGILRFNSVNDRFFTNLINKMDNLKRVVFTRKSMSIQSFICIVEGLKPIKSLNTLEIVIHVENSLEHFGPKEAIKIPENLPQLKKLGIRVIKRHDFHIVQKPATMYALSKSSLEEYRADWRQLDFVKKSSKEPFQLEELTIENGMSKEDIDVDIVMALLHNCYTLKLLMFNNPGGFKDAWMLPILAAFQSWQSMEVFDLDEKSHGSMLSLKSLEFLVDSIIEGKARKLRFLRGNWEVTKTKKCSLKQKLFHSDITPLLVVKVENDVNDHSDYVVDSHFVGRHHAEFLDKFPYHLVSKTDK